MQRIHVILLTAALLCVGILSAADLDTASSFKVTSATNAQVKLTLSAPQPMISSELQNGKKEVSLAGTLKTSDPGAPQLPVLSTMIAIPPQGSFQLSYTYGALELIPLANPQTYTTEDAAIVADNNAPPTGRYPAQIVTNSEPSILRDFRVVQVNVYPYQYDYATQELRYYSDIQISLDFTSEPGINELPDYTTYSYAFTNIYEAQIANFANYRNLVVAPAQARVLLIYGNSTDSTFLNKLNEFVAWKRQKGYEVNVVSTQVAGTSNTAIKNYIQGQYNNMSTRPDYIILMGDTSGSYTIPTFTENLSSYQGEGDYPYTHLAGGDLLGDVMIGRISAENVSQLGTILAKVYAYEKNINNAPDAAAWLNRILLIGDPSSSGISTVYSNKYIHEMTQEVNPAYSYIENYTGGYSSTINSGINQGVGFFNYRGYIGMSGWDPSTSLNNGTKLPHAVILTCGTGSFAYTSTTESFIRLGTEAVPRGALTAIGMATSGTHTMYNNALSAGIFDGIYLYKMRSMGEALLNGKLYLWNIYGTSHTTQANYFAHWCNLMGDPTVETFIGIPGNLHITAPDTVSLGTSLVDVVISDDSGAPVENASVTIYSSGYGNVVAKGFTNAEGLVTLDIPSFIISQVLITASKHDFKPVQRVMDVDPLGSLVYFDKQMLDNGTSGSVGNGDSFVNAGETIALQLHIKNTTANTLTGINSVLSSADPYITVLSSQSGYADLEANATGENLTPFLFTVGPNIPAYHDARLVLNLTDSLGDAYQVIFHIGTYNANLSVSNYSVTAGGNGVLDPSENGFVNISVTNNSVFGALDVSGELTALNDLVLVTDSSSYFGNLPAGTTVTSLEGFALFARPLLIPGMFIPFRLRLFNNNGFEQFTEFSIPIGTVAQNTPLGPDTYGYFIYDISDTNYPDCPSYEWIEIVPSLGGSGTQVTGLSDAGTSGDEGDQVGSDALETIALPFPFTFYGIEYNQITVCVNGFIAMGVTGNGEFRNGRMPGGQGAAPMIAPFWDDLVLLTGGGIFRYYDSENHLFIVQFQNLKNGYNRTSEETFQVIFYDPFYYPTSMADGKIKIQYKVFNNVDVGSSGGYTPTHGNYSSIGIRDHTNTRGLEYSFNNQYPAAAQPLGNLKALLITTVPILHQSPHLVVGELILNDANDNAILEPGETAGIGIKLNNLGINTATEVSITASTLSPYLTIQNPTSLYPDIEGSGSAVNINPITITASPDCSDGLNIALQFVVTIAGNTWTYPQNVTVYKPVIQVNSVFLNDFQGNSNGLAEPGETFKMIVNYTNNSDVDTYNLTSNVMCLSEEVFIVNPQQLLTIIPARSTCQAVYEVSLSHNVIVGNNITFYLTYLGDQITAQNQQILLSVGTTGMMADFETDNGGFVSIPSNYAWQWGSDASAGAHSGTNVWGTLLNTQYPNNVTWTLTSPDVYIGSNFILEFWHYFNMENTYDGGNVKISTNNGGTWTLLTPENGYSMANVSALNGPGFSGSSGGWSLVRCALNAYQNQHVLFRWTFASDTGVQGQGWYIDDVQTTGFFPFAGEISGLVSSSNPQIDYSKVFIHNASAYVTQPDASGNYKLYLPTGTHTVEASATGYETASFFPVVLGLPTPLVNHDYFLAYLAPVESLTYHINADTLYLDWAAPVEPIYPVVSYKLYRRLNAGRFELLEMTSATTHSEYLAVNGSYSFYVVAIYAQGESEASQTISFTYPIVPNDDPNTTPLVTKLGQNYPNPFNPTTSIAFDLAKGGIVKLSIFNLRGQLVKTLSNSHYSPGTYNLVWDGRDEHQRSVASGVYFYRLQTPDYSSTRKMLMLK